MDGVENYPKLQDYFAGSMDVSLYLNPADNGDGSKFAIDAEDVQNQGAIVWMLTSGDLNGTCSDDVYLAKMIDLISKFNKDHKDKIEGIVFDIEPWSKFEDQNSSANQGEWKRYLAKITIYKEKLHKQNLKISAS